MIVCAPIRAPVFIKRSIPERSERGKEFAEAIKYYLVDKFGIDADRITTDGRTKQSIPSEQPGGKRELPFLREGDRLERQIESLEKACRFSILLDFDKSRTIVSYEKFLAEEVVPMISDGSRVIIHGHTDIIGSDE